MSSEDSRFSKPAEIDEDEGIIVMRDDEIHVYILPLLQVDQMLDWYSQSLQ